MKIAIIKTGGKQYKVQEGDKIKIEKIKGKEGDKAVFDEVLLIAEENGEGLEMGKPILKKKVEGKILKQAKDKKIRVLKYKAKTRYTKSYGHRQHFTEVEITKI